MDIDTEFLDATEFDMLAEPFPPEAISWRIGATDKRRQEKETGDGNAPPTKGIAFPYFDARDAMDRLDFVVGPDRWQDRHCAVGTATVCEIGIRFGADWIWKADGAGSTDVEAEKGALSGSFKRAAVRWGIGRYLYHCKTIWVQIDKWKAIEQSEMSRLNVELEKAGNRAIWGDRNHFNLYRLLRSALKEFAADPILLGSWIEGNKGHMAQLKVGARRELQNELNRLIESLRADVSNPSEEPDIPAQFDRRPKTEAAE